MVDEELELEEIRRKKLEQLRQAQEVQLERAQQQAELDSQIESILRPLLTLDAWEQWKSARFAKPDNARIAAANIIKAAQTGQINGKVNKEQLRELLSAVGKSTSKEFKIHYK